MAKRPPTVLIVAGSPEDRATLQRALERGTPGTYICATAPTIAAARALCNSAPPAAVVLDGALPDGDGRDLLSELAEAFGDLTFALIVLIAAEDSATEQRALELGAQIVIKGPDLRRSLGQVVARAMMQLDLRRHNAALMQELAASEQRLEQAALETQRQLSFSRAVLDSSSAHIAVLDRDGEIVAVNSAWARFGRENGLDRTQAFHSVDVGANYLAVCRASAAAGDTDAAQAYTGIQGVLSGDRPNFTIEYACHGPQQQRWFQMRVTPLETPQAGAIVAHTAITQRKLAEAALGQSEAHLGGIIDSAMDAIITVDGSQRIVGWNAAAARMFGCSAAAALGQPLGRFIPLRFRAVHRAYIRAFGQTGETPRAMGNHRPLGALRADGTEFPIEASISRILVGDQVLFTAILRDITKRKRAEDDLRASRQQLMDLSVRLVNAQEDERRALAYELHDEIGQQLTGLNITLEIGSRATANELRARLAEAQQLVASLTSQVRQLSLDLRPPMLDELGLLSTLLWHIQRYRQLTNVAVDFKYSGLDVALPPQVAIAAYRIVQEGITNIARHAQAPVALVRVWTSAGQLKITIEDQGRGFDPTATLSAGRSVGLMGMRERIQLLGGQFNLDSTPGEGTRIRATLPLEVI